MMVMMMLMMIKMVVRMLMMKKATMTTKKVMMIMTIDRQGGSNGFEEILPRLNQNIALILKHILYVIKLFSFSFFFFKL